MAKEIFENYVSPALAYVDSEKAHNTARELLHLAEKNPLTLRLLERFAFEGHRFTDERLKVVVGGITFDNPLIVGAGWDKKGRAVRALYQLGFAGVEVGSVLEFRQKGNDKPRQWVFDNGAAMNRLGFNNPGMEAVAKNLVHYQGLGIPIGISLGVNKRILDKGPGYVFLSLQMIVEKMYAYADYFALNLSTPNTTGLSTYQEKELLEQSVSAIESSMLGKGELKPLFVKIAPDLTLDQIDDVIRVVLDHKPAGIIATNSTNIDLIKAKYGRAGEMGGISGNDPIFRAMATKIINHIYQESDDAVEIIGVGGINSTKTTLEKIKAGARALQIVTAIRQVGTTLPGRINRGLVEIMEQEGINSLEDIRGSNI